jgi:hypothetical protein
VCGVCVCVRMCVREKGVSFKCVWCVLCVVFVFVCVCVCLEVCVSLGVSL